MCGVLMPNIINYIQYRILYRANEFIVRKGLIVSG